MGPQAPPGAHPAPDRPGTIINQPSAMQTDSRPDRSSAPCAWRGSSSGGEGEMGGPDGESSGGRPRSGSAGRV